MRMHRIHRDCNRSLFLCALGVIIATFSFERTDAFQPTTFSRGRHVARHPFSLKMGGRSTSVMEVHRIRNQPRSRLHANPDKGDDGSLETIEGDVGVEDASSEAPSKPAVKAEDLPWFDFSYVQEASEDDDETNSLAGKLPLFTSSLIFVASIIGTIYVYYVGIFGEPASGPPGSL